MKAELGSSIEAASFASVLDGTSNASAAKSKAGTESVAFSQQAPVRAMGSEAAQANMSGLMSQAASTSAASVVSSTLKQGEGTNHYESDSPLKEGARKKQPHRPNDPFYLNFDGDTSVDKASNKMALQAGKFGTIQLTDSNDDAGTKKKKKQKQQHRKEKKEKSNGALFGVELNDGHARESSEKRTAGQFTVYSSDGSDDEDDHTNASLMHRKSDRRNVQRHKEFEGLSKIDLSAKAPKEKEKLAPVEKESKKRRADKEKTKAKKKKSKKKAKAGSRETCEDLLDLANTAGETRDHGQKRGNDASLPW